MRLQRNILSSIFALFFLITTGYACYNIGFFTINEADNVTTTIGLIVVFLLILTVGCHFVKEGGHLDFFQGNNHLYTIIELVILLLFVIITFFETDTASFSTVIALAFMYFAGRISAGRIGGIATTIFGWFFITTSYISILNFDTNLQIISLLACYITFHMTTKNLLHVKDDTLYIFVSYIVMSIVFAVGIALNPFVLFLFLFCFISLFFSSGMDTDDKNSPFASGQKCALYFLGITIGAFFIFNLIVGLTSGTELTGTTIINRFSETFSTRVDSTLFKTASGKTDPNLFGNVLTKYNSLISMLYHAFSSGIWPFLVMFLATVTGYFTIKKDRSYISPLIGSYLFIFFMYIFFNEKGTPFIYLDCIMPVFAGYGFSNLIATETAVWGNDEVDTDVEFVLEEKDEPTASNRMDNPSNYGIKISTGEKSSLDDIVVSPRNKTEQQEPVNPFSDPFIADEEEKEIMLKPLSSKEESFTDIPEETVESMINGATLADVTLSVDKTSSEYNAFSEPYVGGYGESMLGVPEETEVNDVDDMNTASKTEETKEEQPMAAVTAVDLNEIKEMIAKVQEEVSSVIDVSKSEEKLEEQKESIDLNNKLSVYEEEVVESNDKLTVSEDTEKEVTESDDKLTVLEDTEEDITESDDKLAVLEDTEEDMTESNDKLTISESTLEVEEPVAEPEPVLEEEPVVEPEAIVEPELMLEEEPVVEPELAIEPEPVVEEEPEPVLEEEPVVEPELAVEPESVLEEEPVVEPELAIEPEPVLEAEPVVEPEAFAEPEPVLEEEPVVEPELAIEPEPMVEAEPIAEPEAIVEPEPMVEEEPVVEPELAVEPEPVVEEELIAESEPVSVPKIKRESVIEEESVLEEDYSLNKPLRGQDILLNDTRDASAFPEWSLDDLFSVEEIVPDDTNLPSDEELVSMMEESEETAEIKAVQDEELIPDVVEEPSFDDLVTTVQQEKQEEEQKLAKIHEEIKIKMQRIEENEEAVEEIKPHNDLSQLIDRLNARQDDIEETHVSSETSSIGVNDFFANHPDFEDEPDEEVEEISFDIDPNFVEADLAPEPSGKIKREPISARFARQAQKPVESFEISSEPVFLLEDDVKDEEPENVLEVEEIAEPENDLAVEEIETPENELEVEDVEVAENDLAVAEIPEEDENIIHFAKDETDADTTSVEISEPEESLFHNISVSSSEPIVQSAPIVEQPELTGTKKSSDVMPTEQLPDYEEIDNIDEFVTETSKKTTISDGLSLDDDVVVIEDTVEEQNSSDDMGFEFDIDMLTSGVVQPVITESDSSTDDYDDEFAISIDDLTK